MIGSCSWPGPAGGKGPATLRVPTPAQEEAGARGHRIMGSRDPATLRVPARLGKQQVHGVTGSRGL